MTDDREIPGLAARPPVAAARLAIGFAQGIILWLLYRVIADGAWPPMLDMAFAPMVVVAVYVPALVSLGLGTLRPKPLAAWAGLASLVLAGLALHNVARRAPEPPAEGPWDRVLAIAPDAELWLCAAAGLLVAHTLIVAAGTERRVLAPYPTCFEAASRHALQIAAAFAFIGSFWAVLKLGAALFELIGVEAPGRLIEKPWFAIPATTLVFTAAVHVTAIRAGMVRELRTLALTLLSWLLPVMALIAVAFLGTLPFTGLAPLWATRHATGLLIAASAALVVLINAAYQDGSRNGHAPPALRIAGSAAALALVPIVAIAGLGLALRVQQHGWTPDRILAAACIVLAVCPAVGYAVAALRRGPWLRGLEGANLAAAFVALGLLLALFSPVADPARLSVADQVDRLERGEIPPERFDFVFLRFDAGRYGLAALETLRRTQDETVAGLADRALALETRPPEAAWPTPATPQEVASRITVHPDGRTLPESFAAQDWTGMPDPWILPPCLLGPARCDAVLVDLGGDGRDEILVLDLDSRQGVAFTASAEGRWEVTGFVPNLSCAEVEGIVPALRAGAFRTTRPAIDDLEIAGLRLRIEPRACPP